jgi:uncharacterized delta-60 repeat protein
MSWTKDTDFNNTTGFNGTCQFGVKVSNKYLFGGDFTTYKGITASRIARVNTDGSYDATFNTGGGFNEGVRNILVEGDGYYIGGRFTQYNGTTASYITKLDFNGNIDTSFNTGAGFNGSPFPYVYGIKRYDVNRLMVIGNFQTYQGATHSGIVMLNNDGSVDSSFNTGTGFGTTDKAYAFEILNDGKIIVAGNFTEYNGTLVNRVVRLNSDGSLDGTFNGSNTNSTIVFLTPDITGYFIHGGFNTYGGNSVNGICKIDSNGNYDPSVVLPFNSGAFISDVERLNTGKYIISGGFTQFNSITRNRMLRLNSNYTLDIDFDLGTGFNNSTSFFMDIGKIVAHGAFTQFGGQTNNRVIRLKLDSQSSGSETFKFIVNCDCERYTPYRFVWRNRRGGYDTYTFRLKDRKQVNVSKKGYTKFLNQLQTDNKWKYEIGDRGKEEFYSTAFEEVSVVSTWMTEEEHRWLEELYSSVDVYLLEPGYVYRPIVITTNSIEIRDKKGYGNRLLSHNITFIYSYNKIINN